MRDLFEINAAGRKHGARSLQDYVPPEPEPAPCLHCGTMVPVREGTSLFCAEQCKQLWRARVLEQGRAAWRRSGFQRAT